MSPDEFKHRKPKTKKPVNVIVEYHYVTAVVRIMDAHIRFKIYYN